MRQAIQFYLLSVAALTSLVGTRIFPQRAPTGTALPYLTYIVTAQDPDYDQGGFNGYIHNSFEFNSNGATLKDSINVNQALFDALAIQNTVIGDTGKTQFLRSTTQISLFDNFDLFDGSQEGTRIITSTFDITNLED